MTDLPPVQHELPCLPVLEPEVAQFNEKSGAFRSKQKLRIPEAWFTGHWANIYVGAAGEKGRGVFCGEPQGIQPDHMIEEAPAIIFDDNCWGCSDLEQFVYEEEAEYEDGEPYTEYWLGLGFASLYNHSSDPNAHWNCCWEGDNAFIQIWALREIKLGEEITINYHGDPDCKDPWFKETED